MKLFVDPKTLRAIKATRKRLEEGLASLNKVDWGKAANRSNSIDICRANTTAAIIKGIEEIDKLLRIAWVEEGGA